MNPDIDDLCHNLAIDQVLCLGTEGEDCTTTHVVAPNDSCELLTSTYGVNSTILYQNNPQLDAECSNLYVGEVRYVSLRPLLDVDPQPNPRLSVLPAASSLPPPSRV